MMRTFCTKGFVTFANQFHHVRALALLLAVPQDAAFRLDIVINETCDCWAKRLLLVAADPDEEPVFGLETRAESCTNASASTDTDAPLVQR